MHFARLSNSSLLLSDAGRWLLPPPRNLAHAFWADWNAGACVLIQLGTTVGPPGRGSGKFGTPCDRMHSASLTAGSLLATLLGVPVDPQAASATAQLAPASAIHRLSRWLPSVWVILLSQVDRDPATAGERRIGEVGHTARAHALRVGDHRNAFRFGNRRAQAAAACG